MTREEAIKILKSKMDGSVDTSYEWAETVRMAIEALADKPTGKWVNREKCQVDEDAYEVATCSECGAEITIEYPYDSYCPNCGADMRKPKLQYGDTDTLQGGLMSAT